MTDALAAFLRDYHSGTAVRAYEFLGCHPENREGTEGFVFRVWAPNAEAVHVTGDFNFWNGTDLPMQKISRGVWEAWSEYAKASGAYKYLVQGRNGRSVCKADPVGFRTCRAPDTSSVISRYDGYAWGDGDWMAAKKDPRHSPVNIYELHLGSWRRKADGSAYSYSELAPLLAEYVKDMGYTHVELMPLAEYPYDPSWGYQVAGYYAPTSRYGSPGELMELVDILHQNGIGVILDWVPAHFPKDEYGLYEFDGGCAYELSDPAMNEHPDWGTRIFDFGKPEVKSFLISNAVYWLEVFHMDGIRVDAVSSMLYLDYGRSDYRPNRLGGRENLEAIDFLRKLNTVCLSLRPGVIMAAEESTAFPYVTRKAEGGGLGFTLKWNMGWMNDTLLYMKEDPLYRKYHHNLLTFSMTYAFSERYVLPLSHDEVVHCKGSLLSKMPGDYFWKFANLRLLRGYQMAHPGNKLQFMGGEIGQFTEWNYRQELDWMLLDFEMHRKLQVWFRDMNAFYRENGPLWEDDGSWEGYRWIQPDDCDNSLIAFRRVGADRRELTVVCNFTPVRRENYRLGVAEGGTYACVLTSDDAKYGGTGQIMKEAVSEAAEFREYPHSALFDIPPMSISFFEKKAPL